MRTILMRLALAISAVTLLSSAAQAQPSSIEGTTVNASECGTGASSQIVTDKPGGGFIGNRLVGFGETDKICLARIQGTSSEERKAGYVAAVTYDEPDPVLDRDTDVPDLLRKGAKTEFERLHIKYYNTTRPNTPISKIYVKATIKFRAPSPYGPAGTTRSFTLPLALNPSSIPSGFRPNSWAEGTLLASHLDRNIGRFSPRLVSVVIYLKSKEPEQIYFGDLEVFTKGIIRVEQIKTAKRDDCDLFKE